MKFIATGLLLLVSLCSVGAAESTLISNSPFIPFDFKGDKAGGPAAQASGPVEFRGVIDLGDGLQFSLYDTKSQKSYWVREGQEDAQYKVEGYNPKDNSLRILINGSMQTIAIKKPSDQPVQVNPLTGRAAQAQTEAQVKSALTDPPPKPGEIKDPAQRKEMADKVFGAFKKYVEQRRAATEASRQN